MRLELVDEAVAPAEPMVEVQEYCSCGAKMVGRVFESGRDYLFGAWGQVHSGEDHERVTAAANAQVRHDLSYARFGARKMGKPEDPVADGAAEDLAALAGNTVIISSAPLAEKLSRKPDRLRAAAVYTTLNGLPEPEHLEPDA